ncbi:hypothetical protein QTP88_003589 [Uroleucon formosanum]
MTTSLNIQQSLSILLWNANGLNQQKNELKAFLQLSHVDIILISEAHLTLNSSFKLPGYISYHYDQPSGNAHAGSAIIIKSNIKHSTLPSYQSNSIQATNIKINLNHIPTTISSAYFPPQAKLNSNELTNYLLSIGNNYLIGSDFNCKHTSWDSRITNTRGRILHNVIQNKNLKFLFPPNPTYWPTHQNRQPDILDFFITNLPNHINRNISNLSDLSSDHTPVLLTLNDHVTLKTTYPTLTPGKINWQIFSESVESQVSLNISLKNHTDIDNAVLSLTDIIKNSATRAFYTHSPKTKQDNLPLHLSRLLTEKRRARARWQRTHLPNHFRVTKSILMSELQSALLLKKQLTELHKNPVEGFSAGLIDDNDIYKWEVLIIGPPDTLYEGGFFKAHVNFPKEYPLRPPKMKFVTEIWHPNIDKSGDVCISILHEPGDDKWGYEKASERWLPVHTVETILISVISMLADPNDESPANVDAAKDWRDNYPEFKRKVARCVRKSQEDI